MQGEEKWEMNVILCEEMKDVLLFNFHWKIKALSIVNGEEHMICADFSAKGQLESDEN